MRDQPLTARNQHDEDGMPAGGTAHALGLEVNFQDGPLQVSASDPRLNIAPGVLRKRATV